MNYSNPNQLVFVFRKNQVGLKNRPHQDRPIEFLTIQDLLSAGLKIDALNFQFCNVGNGLEEANNRGLTYICCEAGTDTILPDTWAWLSMRELAMASQDIPVFQKVSQAYQIVQWDKNHQFCGSCGRPTKKSEKERSRICTGCHLSFFPRISPSVIVIVKKEDQILLARSPHFAPGLYSAIAGFVEVGESLEQSLVREVQEEVGIKIHRLKYRFSQSWPFPDSLMLGFTAEYQSGEISVDGVEIEDAQWFGADHLPTLPMKVSIARALIQYALEDC